MYFTNHTLAHNPVRATSTNSNQLCISTLNLYDGDHKQTPHRPCTTRRTHVLPNVIAKDSDHA
jgi:hypothetical protein